MPGFAFEFSTVLLLHFSSCPVISTDRPVSSNALPRSSQLVYEDMVQPVEARLNYCEPPLPRFVSEGTSCSSGGNTCQAMASLNVANYSSRNSPNPSQCHGSPCSSGDANSTRESVTFSVERVDTTMSDAPEVSADREEVQVVEPADNSDMSNHYEYAEPGDAAAWYYHHNRSSNDENENERRGLRPSETESLYTEGSAFRYHVITMRPRLGSDGGQNVRNSIFSIIYPHHVFNLVDFLYCTNSFSSWFPSKLSAMGKYVLSRRSFFHDCNVPKYLACF